jgi:hypothetical protein
MKHRFSSRFPKRGSHVVLVGGLLMVVLTLSAFSFAPTAYAASVTQTATRASVIPNGPNGQQIEVWTTAHSVRIVGDSPIFYSARVNHCFDVPPIPPGGVIEWYPLPGWWWSGSTTIRAYARSECQRGSYVSKVTYDVPLSQPTSDWFNVYVDY